MTTLYAIAENNHVVNVCKILAAASGVKLNLHLVSSASGIGSKYDHVISLPAVETVHGFFSGSSAVIRFFAKIHPESLLNGDGVLSQTKVDQWIDFALGDLYSSLVVARGSERLFEGLNLELLHSSFLGSYRFTAADAAVLCSLASSNLISLLKTVEKYPNLVRWIDVCVHQTCVQVALEKQAEEWCLARGIQTYAAAAKERELAGPSFRQKLRKVLQPEPVKLPSAVASSSSSAKTSSTAVPATTESSSSSSSAETKKVSSKPTFEVKSYPASKPNLKEYQGPFSVLVKGREKPLGAFIAAKLENIKLTLKQGTAMGISLSISSNESINGDVNITQFLLQAQTEKDPEVWKWSNFAQRLTQKDLSAYNELNNHLTLRTFVVGHTLTAADIIVYAGLQDAFFSGIRKAYDMDNIERYMSMLKLHPTVVDGVQYLQEAEKNSQTAPQQAEKKENESQAKSDNKQSSSSSSNDQWNINLELDGVEYGKVVTRFPPEPSGYLHIGHAKAVFLNYAFAKKYNGKMILRFDDTNPEKEKSEYEDAILEDLGTLGIVPDLITRTSDSFDLIQKHAEDLLRRGLAYMDKTEREKMQQERMDGINSIYRDQPVEENLRLWAEMLKGSKEGQTACMRAKIDMQAENKALRDPVCFRYSGLAHPSTGTKYICYPTYDFACPIVDAVEGVTHALRDRQFQDRNDQYAWFLNSMNLREVRVWGFSRMNFVRCLLSKRKIIWFIQKNLIDGWNDPRVPTVKGILRRGLTVEALRGFVFMQGASKNLNLMQWDSLWALNKKILDPIVPRFTALASNNLCSVKVTNYEHGNLVEYRTKDSHPKNPEVGKKVVAFGPNILLEQVDAATVEKDEKITLMNWGNAYVREVKKDSSGVVKSLSVELALDDKDFKKTKKFTWLTEEPHNQVKCVLIELDHLITKDKLEEEERLEDFLTEVTMTRVEAVGDLNLRTLSRGTHIQVERKGFYIVDKISNEDEPMHLIFVPDGHTA